MEDALSVDTILLRARSGRGAGLVDGLVSRVSDRIVKVVRQSAIRDDGQC